MSDPLSQIGRDPERTPEGDRRAEAGHYVQLEEWARRARELEKQVRAKEGGDGSYTGATGVGAGKVRVLHGHRP